MPLIKCKPLGRKGNWHNKLAELAISEPNHLSRPSEIGQGNRPNGKCNGIAKLQYSHADIIFESSIKIFIVNKYLEKRFSVNGSADTWLHLQVIDKCAW